MAEIVTDPSITHDPSIHYDQEEDNSEIVKQLSDGFLAYFMDDAKEAECRIKELTHSQQVLIEALQHENGKFADCKAYTNLDDTMSQAKMYLTKLITLKKDMISIQEKSSKLKRRVLKLQQQRQKQLLQLEQKRERELERERQLTAKTVQRQGAL